MVIWDHRYEALFQKNRSEPSVYHAFWNIMGHEGLLHIQVLVALASERNP